MVLADVFQLSVLPLAVLVVLGSMVVIVGGQSLPLWLRTAVTVLVVYWAFSTSLVGRTMEPGLSLQTASLALTYLGMLGLPPLLSALRAWDWPMGAIVLALSIPTAVLSSFLVAHVEEAVFVWIHREHGSGPKPRWTVTLVCPRPTG